MTPPSADDKKTFQDALLLADQLEAKLNSLRSKGYEVGATVNETSRNQMLSLDIELWGFKVERISLA